MSLPNVNITKTSGNLGRTAPSEDGISAIIATGVAVAESFDLGDILGPFYSPLDAEAVGIDADYDTDNSVMVYQHILDFYSGAGAGTKLYIMVVADTVTMADMADKTKTYAALLLATLGGEVRMVAITKVKTSVATTNGLDDDAITAAENAQALAEAEFDLERPVDFWIEGRDYQGVAANLLDLHDVDDGPNANAVSIVISQDLDIADNDAAFAAYANVCYAMGIAARIHVGRNIGRVLNGSLDIGTAALSDGTTIEEAGSDLDTIDAKGYILVRTFPGKAGYYFNNDYNACPLTDDYAKKSLSRVINKAARLTYQVYVNYINDDVEVDEETGKLSQAVIKAYQKAIEKKIDQEMTNNINGSEISGVSAYVDPDQNILSTELIEAEVTIVPKGNVGNITVTLGFTNPLLQ